MQQQLIQYFAGEKLGGLGFGLAGLIAVVLAALVWRSAVAYRAMLYPLLIVAAIEIGVCVALQLRTDAQVARLSEQLQRDPQGYREAELARMRRVNLSFRVIEAVEIALWLAGVVLAFTCAKRPALFAVGLGLILQASAMLVADLAAERRAHIYTAAIETMGR
jgi:MFS family permease